LIDLIITVEDTGIGIPKTEQGKIFEDFQQMDVKLQSQVGLKPF